MLQLDLVTQALAQLLPELYGIVLHHTTGLLRVQYGREERLAVGVSEANDVERAVRVLLFREGGTLNLGELYVA